MIDFFQTLNIKRFIFADGDNANNPKAFIDFLNGNNYLELDTQVVCLIGANKNQNSWYNTAVKYIQSLNKNNAFNVTPIRISTEGENALDMVLSSYVGLSMGKNPQAEFIIVSNDTDYNSVIEHFHNLGVKISQQKIDNSKNKSNHSSKTQKTENGLSQKTVDEIIKKILKMKKPKTVDKLKNILKNNFEEVTSENLETYTKAVIKKLEKQRKVSVNGQSLAWKSSTVSVKGDRNG